MWIATVGLTLRSTSAVRSLDSLELPTDLLFSNLEEDNAEEDNACVHAKEIHEAPSSGQPG
ncbi:hypothetical protein N7495_003025 [Penicillium taxi]|uniref:uncharacterized protein n=1 Tax=Penicillium taxi TaxID=168475 RepID=UPI002545BB9B|nr:uncharacterized protein N7495_003025 [Penicillium taxi]KAJ5902497.1 hypothetical protein N7495_003025 [Penicillium taxi]